MGSGIGLILGSSMEKCVNMSYWLTMQFCIIIVVAVIEAVVVLIK